MGIWTCLPGFSPSSVQTSMPPWVGAERVPSVTALTALAKRFRGNHTTKEPQSWSFEKCEQKRDERGCVSEAAVVG